MYKGTSIRIVKRIKKPDILRNTQVNAYYRSIFDKCDVDNDDYVNVSDLKTFIDLHENIEISEEVAQRILSRFDKDDDGMLDFQEFLDFINNPTIIRTFKKIGSRYITHIAVSSTGNQCQKLRLKRKISCTGHYEEEFSFSTYTVGMLVLCVIQFICYHVEQASGSLADILKFIPSRRHEVWRYLTYIIIVDAYDLVGNILFQIPVGLPLEIVYGWRLLVIYAVGAVGGSLTHFVFNRNLELVGGLAGIYAFLTAHIAVVLLNWRKITHPLVHLTAFIVIVGFNLLFTQLKYNSHINNYCAQLAGAIFGLLLGVIILKNVGATKTERILWWMSLAIFVVLMVILVMLNCNIFLLQ